MKMLGRSKLYSLLLRAVIVATLASHAVAIKKKPLQSINEELPLPDKPSRSFQQAGAAIRSQIAQLTGPIDADLYPPVQPASTATPPPLRYTSLRTVPVTGLVRGQQGRLIAYRLKTPFQISAIPAHATSGVSSSGFPWTLRRTDPDEPPSTNRQMRKVLSSHPDIKSTYDAKAIPDPLALGTKYHAVRLRGYGLDVQTLAKLQEAERPFYVLGARNKVWYFHKQDGKEYTFTDRVSSADRRFIRAHFAPAREGSVPTPEVALESEVEAAVAAILAGQNHARPSETGNSLPQRVWEAVRAFFSRAVRRT